MGEAKQIKLGMFIRPRRHHIASWRHPDACADAGVNFRHMVEIAQNRGAWAVRENQEPQPRRPRLGLFPPRIPNHMRDDARP